MHLRLFKKDDDYSILKDWCQEHQVPLVEKDDLTDFGMLVIDNEKEVAVAWLYPMMTSNICMIRFPISNPEIQDKEKRAKYLKYLFSGLHDLARKMNYKKVFITTNHKSLQEKLKDYKYIEEAHNCKHFIGVL